MSEAAINSFAYQAQTIDGSPITGTIDAADPDQASRLLANLRLRVIQMGPAQRAVRAKPLGATDFTAFNQQLAQLTAAGLPVEHGLRLIAQDMRSSRLAETVRQVAGELERGTPLAEAFGKFEGRFPPLYGKLVAAGVKSNNLSGMLLNLGRHMDLVARLRGMLWRAISYPMMVMLALAAVLIFLGIVVIPQFASLFKGFGITLPAATLMLLELSRWAPVAAVAIVALIIAGPLIWPLVRAFGMDRAVVDRLLLPLPLIGPVLERNLIARWCDALRLGVHAGIDLPAAIEMAGEAVGSPALVRDGKKLQEMLAAGNRLDGLEQTEILPATVPAAMALASDHHDLPAMLETLADMYQQQAQTKLAVIPTILTPMLIMAVAVIIGFVVLALFAPFFSLLQSLTS